MKRAFSSRRARRDRVFLVAVRNVRFRASYARTPTADAMDGAVSKDEGRALRVLAFYSARSLASLMITSP
jgi:hypothetical protein